MTIHGTRISLSYVKFPATVFAVLYNNLCTVIVLGTIMLNEVWCGRCLIRHMFIVWKGLGSVDLIIDESRGDSNVVSVL